MKSLINWIFYIPVFLLAVAVQTFAVLAPAQAESFFGTDSNGLAEILIIAIVCLTVLVFVVSMFNRNTSPIHILRRNFFSGITAVLAGFALAANAAGSIAGMVTEREYDAMGIITVVFASFAAVALLLIGINHCSGTNTNRPLAILYLTVPLWCCAHLVDRFLDHTATPVAAAQTMDLIMFVFLALFFIYATMVLSQINGKNPVKTTVLFGMPASVICVIYGISVFFTNFLKDGYSLILESSAWQSVSFADIIPAFVYVLLGIYALSVCIELSFHSLTKDVQRVVDTGTAKGSKDISDIQQTDDTDDADTAAVGGSDSDSQLDTDSMRKAAELTDTNISSDVKKQTPERGEVRPRTAHDSSSEDVIALELLAAAKASDGDKDISGQTAGNRTSASDIKHTQQGVDEMYIEDENKVVNPEKNSIFTKRENLRGDMPRKATVREAVVDDEDYIMTSGFDSDLPIPTAPASRDEGEFTDFIFAGNDKDPQLTHQSDDSKYESRLDEIDKLIISIQSGEEPEKPEDN